MKKPKFNMLAILAVIILIIPLSAKSQDEDFAAGMGAGLEYGGIGANLLFNQTSNFGFFAGAGFAFAGMGINAGVQLRSNYDQSTSSYRFFLIAMYGYQTAVTIWDAREHNKLFYGPSAGVGMNVRFFKKSDNYLSFGLVVPFRNRDFQNYVDELSNKHGINFPNKPSLLSTSIGYHIIL